jgi:N-formylglutamate amidohydrolase
MNSPVATEPFVSVLHIDAPSAQSRPMVLASPHSGRRYPASFLAQSALDPLTLRRSEDSYVDELFAAAPEKGVPLLKALFPRAFIDVNRDAYELASPRAWARSPAKWRAAPRSTAISSPSPKPSAASPISTAPITGLCAG